MQLQALVCVLVALVFNGVHGGHRTVTVNSFSFVDCGAAAGDPIWYNSVTVTPDPITFPGVITVNANTGSNVEADSPIPLHIELNKIIGGFPVEIPCFQGVGSCDYDDLCALLDEQFDPSQPCPASFQKYDFPCHCPFPVKTYTITDLQLPINVTIPETLVGDYTLTSKSTYNGGSELSCVQLSFSISKA